MTFPLSKEEHDFLDSVEEILNHSNGVAFSEYELTRYSDLITLMKAKHVLIDTSSFDGIQFTLTGSFKAFQDWIKAEEEKYITANNDIVNITLHIFSKITSSDENPHSHGA